MLWDAQIHQLEHNQHGLELLTQYSQSSSSHYRAWRGLLNIIGHLSKGLFGTATTEDINVLRHAVEELQANSQHLNHNKAELLTVFNKTHHLLGNTIFGMQADHAKIQQLASNLELVTNITNDLTQNVTYMQFARKMDINIQQLQDIFGNYADQNQEFCHQRMQLQRGWLTEEILPPDILNTILQRMRVQHLATLPTHWYYENLPVHPLWDNKGQLAFKVSLPGLTNEPYLYHKLCYFHVNWGKSMLRKIVGHNEIAINTATGRSFIPKKWVLCWCWATGLLPKCSSTAWQLRIQFDLGYGGYWMSL